MPHLPLQTPILVLCSQCIGHHSTHYLPLILDPQLLSHWTHLLVTPDRTLIYYDKEANLWLNFIEKVHKKI